MSQDSRTRYTKKKIPDDLWMSARASALKQGKTIINWLCDAIREKLEKENK